MLQGDLAWYSNMNIKEFKNNITKDTGIIVIDGRSAAGKTTLANELAKEFNGEVIHMDDFFLPIELRTEERFNEPGGNVHYERFLQEVKPYLLSKESFSYRLFNCKKMDFDGECFIRNNGLVIVEGAYSLHPAFGDYGTLRVFYDITKDTQYERILNRDGIEKTQQFVNRWIPFEEKYIKETNLFSRVDIILN